jgi:hypothetical protein
MYCPTHGIQRAIIVEYPNTVKPVHHQPPLRLPASYQAKHVRVRAVRGKASEYTCEMCGPPTRAAHWATLHGTEGNDPYDYAALCVKCHLTYDRVAEKARATRNARKARAGGSNATR